MHGYDDAGLRRLSPPATDDLADSDDTAASALRRQAAGRRDAGVRQIGRISGWTAAGLVAGVAAGAGYFAHAVPPTAVPASATAVQGTVGSTGQKPSLTHPVVTSGGSGVTAGTAGGSSATGGAAASGNATAQWRDN